MVVDAEMGMPLDLSRYECLWQEGGDPLELNPDPNNPPPVDPKDEFLLEGLSMQSQGGTSSQAAQFSWLRRTEYVTAKDGASRMQILTRDEEDATLADVSREAQIQAIEATFPASYRGIEKTTLRHPTNPKRRAVECYELFPDPETFPTLADVFRFPERPGDRSTTQDDPRLDSAILRPVVTDDGENFIAYYLARSEDAAREMKRQRNFALEMNISTEDNPVPFDLVRDYETKQFGNEGSELVLFFDNGDLPPHVDAVGSSKEGQQRPKGVYYKNISRRHTLKKRRVDPNDPGDYSTKADTINLTYRSMDEAERLERENDMEEVMNPMYEPPEEQEEEEQEEEAAVDRTTPRNQAVDVFGGDDDDDMDI
ncbi:hypothetical protein FRC18_011197 [Serendipita sp. 400]|nr:hypothetical protein FRC18_011197 [Serendipita sp. 400]